MLSTYYLIQAI